MRENLGLFFFFGLVASLIDRVWVAVGCLTYDPAAFLRIGPFRHLDTGAQPWWVPLQYGVMGVVAVQFAAFVIRFLTRRDAPAAHDPTAAFAVSASWFIVAQLGGGLADVVHPIRFALFLLLIWLVRFLLQDRQHRGAILAISLALGVAGTAGEALLVYLGIMTYTRPAFLGLPWWVPGLWITAAFFARDIARAWFVTPDFVSGTGSESRPR
jgi:hypothetical protein